MPRTQNSRQAPPTTHVASAPGEVWCWDMTYLPSAVTGQWFYLYLILDLYSRKVIGFEVHERDSSDHAVELLKRVALTEGLHGLPPEQRPVLHARVRHEPLQVLDLHKEPQRGSAVQISRKCGEADLLRGRPAGYGDRATGDVERSPHRRQRYSNRKVCGLLTQDAFIPSLSAFL